MAAVSISQTPIIFLDYAAQRSRRQNSEPREKLRKRNPEAVVLV